MKKIKGGVTAPLGFLASGIHCGIKEKGLDLSLIFSKIRAQAVALYTTNKLKGAPLIITKNHLKKNNKASAIIINSGNANTGNGDKGIEDAQKMAYETALALNIKEEEVLVASTGIIGVPLPINKIIKGIKRITKLLSRKGGRDAALGIMTTDKSPKEYALSFTLDNKKINIGAMSKGAGMIHPKLATTLTFITTDICINYRMLKKALKESVDKSLNLINIDGDTSPNDMVIILANGLAENRKITKVGVDFYKFQKALDEVLLNLAQMIVRDGEGATKFIQIEIENAKSISQAKEVAFTISKSPLVKSSFFGEDFNFGRIITAIGYSNTRLEIEKIDMYLGNELVVKDSHKTSINQRKIKNKLKKKDIYLKIDLKQGREKLRIWTTDLSPEYVKINSIYSS